MDPAQADQALPAGTRRAEGRSAQGLEGGAPLDGQHGDDELLRRIAGGCNAAMEQFATRHFKYVCAILVRGECPHDLVEDFAQHTLIQTWRSASKFTTGSSDTDTVRRKVRAWLGTIARNRLMDFWRSRPSVHLDDHTWSTLAEDRSTQSKDGSSLLSLLRSVIANRLTERERSCLFASADDASVLAESLGVQATTVRKIRQRTREKIKRIMVSKLDPSPGVVQ